MAWDHEAVADGGLHRQRPCFHVKDVHGGVTEEIR